MLLDEVGGGVHGVVLGSIVCSRKREAPATGPLADVVLVVPWFESSGRKDPAVVGATGARPMFVDRAGVVDEHRATTALVVAEEHMTAGQPRRRKEQLRIDVRQRVPLVRSDV